MMKEKIFKAMSKLRSTPLTISNAYVYFNMYLIIHMYFGYGMISLTPKQEQLLMKISETTLLRKVGLSEKFPRKILYARKLQLGVGILKPSTILTILSLKLYLGHRRNQDDISKQIIINEKEAHFQYGYNKEILEIDSKYKPSNQIWSDEIGQRLIDRRIKLCNVEESKYVKTTNKTIMDYAIEYAKEKEMDEKIIQLINHVRLYKRIILPYELVSLMGREETKSYKNELERSYLMWKVPFPILPKPSKKSIGLWLEFI